MYDVTPGFCVDSGDPISGLVFALEALYPLNSPASSSPAALLCTSLVFSSDDTLIMELWWSYCWVLFLVLTYPRVISYRGASERAEDHSPRSGQMHKGFTDSFGVLHFLCLCLGNGEERAGPGEGQARQGCFVLQNRAEKSSNTTQAMLCGDKLKTRARKPISLELFMLRNSNRPSSAELLSQARQSAAPSLLRWSGEGCFKTTTT